MDATGISGRRKSASSSCGIQHVTSTWTWRHGKWVRSLTQELALTRGSIVTPVYGLQRQSYSRGDRGWLSHGLVVTLPISYSLDGGTPLGFTRDLRIAD